MKLSTIKPRLAVAALAIAVSALGLGTGMFVTHHSHAQNVRKPFLAQFLIKHNVDGALVPKLYITEAQRSDGSWATETLLTEDAAKTRAMRQVCLRDPGTLTDYDPETNLALTKRIGNVLKQRLTAPIPPDCLQAHPGMGTATCVDAGKTVLGYPVMTLVRTFQAGDVTHTIEELVAPALDFKTLSYARFAGNGEIKETRVAVSLAEGEPAPGMFTIPAGATFVAKASEFVGPFEAKRGRHVDANGLEMMNQRFGK